MKALTYDGHAVRVVEHPEPLVPEGFARVRMVLAGICNTDLEITHGYLGFAGVLGHELLGVVEQGPLELVGKRVVAEINFACGRCPTCQRGLGRHCPARTVMGIVRQDGAFAEAVAVPVGNLHVVPDEVPDEAAVFTEPLAAAFEILEQVRPVRGVEALVLGDGKLGLLAAMVLENAGVDVRLVGKHAEHLDIAHARGIRTELLAAWDRTPRDLVVDATGRPEGLALAIAATRPRGTLVLKSTVAKESTLSLAPLVINEITVVGSRCGPFQPALAALASAAIEPRHLIAARHDLADGVAALARAGQPGALKVLLHAG